MKHSFKTIFLVLTLGMLSACGGNSATVRFNVIAMLEVDGQVKEFSNVMQVQYTRKVRSALGYGGSSKMWGEALIIDFGQRGKAYLLNMRFANRQYFSVYDSGILRTFDIDASVGSLKADDLDKLTTLKGRKRLVNTNHKRRDVQPSFIAFEDELDPNSVFLLNDNNFDSHFGDGVRLIGIDVEITQEDITQGELIKNLPWLSKKYSIGFERRPAGPSRLLGDQIRPLKWYMNYNIFYAGESR